MDIKPIKTERDYRAALKEIEGLMMATPDSPEGEKLDVMVTLVEAYENKHFPLDLPDPVEAIKLNAQYQHELTVLGQQIQGREQAQKTLELKVAELAAELAVKNEWLTKLRPESRTA